MCVCVRVNPHGAMAEPRISHILSGILSGIFSAILSDIFSGIMSDICSDILSGSLSGVLSGMCSVPHSTASLAVWHSGPQAPKKQSTSTTRSVDLKDDVQPVVDIKGHRQTTNL